MIANPNWKFLEGLFIDSNGFDQVQIGQVAFPQGALQPGDLIIEVQGVPIHRLVDLSQALCRVKSGPVSLRLRRANREELQAVARAVPSGKPYAAVALVGVVLALLSSIVLILRPDDREGRTFFGALSSAAILCATVAGRRGWAGLSGYSWAHKTSLLAVAAMLALFGYLYTIFPRQLSSTAAKFFRPALGLIPVTAAATVLLTPQRVPIIFLFFISLIAPLFTLTLVWQFIDARTAGDDKAKALLRILIWSAAAGLCPLSIGTLLKITNANFWLISNLLVLIFPFGWSYAILRKNLLSVDAFTAAAVGYALSIITIALLTLALLFCLPLLLDETFIQSRTFSIAITAIVVAGFMPALRAIKNRIDKFFFQQRRSEAQMADAMRELVRVIQNTDRSRAYKAGLATALELQAPWAELWCIDDTGSFFKHRAQAGERDKDLPQEIDRNGPLGKALSKGAAGGVQGLCKTLLSLEAQDQLWSLGLAMAAPVTAYGVFAGWVGVARKRTGSGYDDQDLSYLRTIAAHLGLATEHAKEEGVFIGRYRIEKRLGIGGMAEVFLAWQLGAGGFERRVALKRPLPDMADDPSCIAMFLDEARISAQLHHQNIAQVFEIDKENGMYFLAMEYIDGPSLRQVIRRMESLHESIPLPICGTLGNAILSALSHAHDLSNAQGEPLRLVHRDVTPGNILLGMQGEVKLVDFGIARAASRLNKTQTGVVKGTLPYMSPEQATGSELDGRSDLFSVGAVLYELLTLRRAFPDGWMNARGAALLWNPETPAKIRQVIERALHRDREARYSTAEEMRLEWQAALETTASDETLSTWIRTSATIDTTARQGEPTDETGGDTMDAVPGDTP